MSASSEGAFVILDMAEFDEWRGMRSGRVPIPERKRSTVVQLDRSEAEAELLRLADRNGQGRFVLFEAVAATVRVDMPTHVNLAGKPLMVRSVSRVVPIDADDIPF